MSSATQHDPLFSSPTDVSPSRRVGVLGGGQLARMMTYAAHRLNMEITVLDPDPEAPGGKTADLHIIGSFRDQDKILELAKHCDVVTVEIEHVNTEALSTLRQLGIPVQPAPVTLSFVQDKYAQKKFLMDNGVPVGRFVDAPSEADVVKAAEEFGYPMVLKSKRLAYDGRGNAVVHSASDIASSFERLSKNGQIYIEKFVPFVKELAVMVARGLDGSIVSYPVVETIQENNVCKYVIAPAQVSATELKEAQKVAEKAVGAMDGAGIYGVELFLLADGEVLFNEIAPRPHNSGHYTIEACVTDQFEQHLRCVTGLPLGDPSMTVGAAVMVNILGGAEDKIDASLLNKALKTPGLRVHWYGKTVARTGRKMGHLNITGSSLKQIVSRLTDLGMDVSSLKIDIGDLNIDQGLKLDEELKTDELPAFVKRDATEPPLVGVIMGSDSDLPTMRECAQILAEFDIPFEVTIVSAHRTPERLIQYARTAHKRGMKVIVAGAGGAAHLPGMVASMTPLPVIGVPVRTKGALDGVDALYSIVQMPKGVPVATVAIGNAANAGLLAVRILGTSDPEKLEKMLKYQIEMRDTVLKKASDLADIGWERYGLPYDGRNIGFNLT